MFINIESNLRIIYFLKICAILIVLLLGIYLKIIGVVVGVAASILLLLFFGNSKLIWPDSRRKYFWFLTLSVGVLLCWIFSENYSFDLFRSTLRGHLVISSLSLLKQNLFFGIGIGNWIHQVYQYDVSHVSGLNHPYLFYKVADHNVFLTYLVELGILGFSILAIPICYLMYKYYKTSVLISAIGCSVVSIIFLYFLFSNVYGGINIMRYYFSEMDVLLFMAMMILSHELNLCRIKISKITKFCLVLAGLASTLWYTMEKINFDNYNEVNQIQSNDGRKLDRLQRIYDSNFHSVRSYNKIVELDLAKEFRKEGYFEKSRKLLESALEKSPYNHNIIIEYVDLLSSDLGDYKKALKYAHLLKIGNSLNNTPNMLLAKLYTEQCDYEKAVKYLNQIQYKNLEATSFIRLQKSRLDSCKIMK